MLYIVLIISFIISHMQAMHFVLFTPHSSCTSFKNHLFNPHALPIWDLFIGPNKSLIEFVLLIYSCLQDHLLECGPFTGNHTLKKNLTFHPPQNPSTVDGSSARDGH